MCQIFLLLTFFILFTICKAEYNPCRFCPGNLWSQATFGPSKKMSGYFVGEKATCNTHYMEALLNATHCEYIIHHLREICCNENIQGTGVPQPPPVSFSGIVYPKGKYPICHLCESKLPPTKKSPIITSPFLGGSYSCAQLYDYGLKGNVLNSLCYPLQVYSKDRCGCIPNNNTRPIARNFQHNDDDTCNEKTTNISSEHHHFRQMN